MICRAHSGSTSVGSSTGIQLYYTQTKNWKNGTVVGGTGVPAYGGGNDTAADDTNLKNFVVYDIDAGWRQTNQAYTNKYGTGTSSWNYGTDGVLQAVTRSTNGYQDVWFYTDTNGMVIERWEEVIGGSGPLPRTHTYRFGGKEMGVVTNNSTTNTDYATLIDRRDNAPGTGNFLGGATTGTPYASFDANHITLAGGAQDDTPGSWTVRTGDTLQSIALAIWGDANLWYKIAQANGASDSGLAEGQTLVIPGGVGNIRNNADTIKPYDPLRAMGDVAPPQATPQPPKHHGCGILGTILLAAIAIGVAAIIGPEILGAMQTAFGTVGGAIAAGAVAGAAGSIASQAVGLATGLQDKFSFTGVALAALGGAVGGGLSGVKAFGEAASGSLKAIGNAAIQGAAGSAITQGIAVATGLQDKFSWAGVAAAGVAAGVGEGLGKGLEPLSGEGSSQSLGNIAGHAAVGMASLIGSAATRSAIEGTSFGDNLVAGLPDVIGQVIGSALAGAVQKPHIDPLQVALDDGVTGGSTGHQEQQATNNQHQVNATPVAASVGSAGGSVAAMAEDVDAPLARAASVVPKARSDVQRQPAASENLSAPPEIGFVESDSIEHNAVLTYDGFINQITITADAPQHSFGWQVADFLGFHGRAPDLLLNSPLPFLGGQSINSIGASAETVTGWLSTSIGVRIPKAVDVGPRLYLESNLYTSGAYSVYKAWTGDTQPITEKYSGMRDATVSDLLAVIPDVGVAVKVGTGAIRELGGAARIASVARGPLISDVRAISAVKANAPFLAKELEAPYSLGSQVRTFTTAGELKFVRLTTDSPEGMWLARADEIAGMTPQQIQQHLALPEVPTHMLDVMVPTGTRMQTGIAAAVPKFNLAPAGGFQYQLLDKLPSTSFGPMRPLP